MRRAARCTLADTRAAADTPTSRRSKYCAEVAHNVSTQKRKAIVERAAQVRVERARIAAAVRTRWLCLTRERNTLRWLVSPCVRPGCFAPPIRADAFSLRTMQLNVKLSNGHARLRSQE